MASPYFVIDADLSFPSGDAFIVYQYKDFATKGIGIKVFYEGLQDMRALYTLGKKVGREKVLEILDNIAKGEITFLKYQKNSDFFFELRKTINKYLQCGECQ